MPNRLYVQLDPQELDRFTSNRRLRPRRKLSWETRQALDQLRRSLRELPPREAVILYLLKVLRLAERDIATQMNVRQSNVSYRVLTALRRIELHHARASLISETAFRNVLILSNLAAPPKQQLSPHDIQIVLAAAKTFSQKLVGEAHGATRNKFIGVWKRAQANIARWTPSEPYYQNLKKRAQDLFALAELNWNRLAGIEPQGRFRWKVGDSLKPPKTTQNALGRE